MVSLLLRGGRRVRDVVRAMRGYVNLGSREAVAVPLLPLLVDVYQLFADRLRPRLIDRREPSPISSELRPAMLLVAPLSVQVVRSELSILLSRWLLRTIRPAHPGAPCLSDPAARPLVGKHPLDRAADRG
jgi:hypothetical protein